MQKIILLTVAGDHPPEATAAAATATATIAEILASHNAGIRDIAQSSIHGHLHMGVVVELGAVAAAAAETASTALLNDLTPCMRELGLSIGARTLCADEYAQWVSEQKNSRYIITLMARHITPAQIAAVSKVAAQHELSVERITRLSHLPEDDGRGSLLSKACAEFTVCGKPAASIKEDFLTIASELEADIALQQDDMYRRTRRLVVFDMDSTLIQAEVIDELAKEAGVGEQVTAITEEAMQGHIDFTESFARRVGLLKGLDESVLERIAQRLPLTEGIEHLMKTLKQLGYTTAILSGGFTYFGAYLQRKLGFDYVHANELEIENGAVTGRVTGTVVDGKRKAELLKEIAAAEGIDLHQTIAVGDGANDLPMLATAGLGVAFRAKPVVRQRAQHSISTLGLDGVLYLLGIGDRDIP